MLPSNLTRLGFDVADPNDEKINVESLKEIRDFISAHFEKVKCINLNKKSYGLKDHVERILKVYIKNGDFIAAMILEGYNYKQMGMNCYFNISEKSINKLFIMMKEAV